MKKLNKNGIYKIIEYVSSGVKYVSDGSRHMMVGLVSENDKKALKDINVILTVVEDLTLKEDLKDNVILYEAELDDTEVQDETNNEEKVDDFDIRNVAKELIPILSEFFPSKEEVNAALNDLKAQMIDPNEMIDGLKMQMQRIKKQSRETDEVG